jgi:hypothetical protein
MIKKKKVDIDNPTDDSNYDRTINRKADSQRRLTTRCHVYIHTLAVHNVPELYSAVPPFFTV